MEFRRVSELDVEEKTIFCRVDFNVPLDGTSITDDRRIRAAIPTILSLAERGGRVLCASHLGRPKGERVESMSLRPVAERLEQILEREVGFASDCVGAPAAKLSSRLETGGIGLLENLRFHAGETEGDEAFARALASPAELFVGDAFGTAHRPHASVVGVPAALGNGAAGFLMEKELDALGQLVASPRRPYAAILGGAKVSDKIPLLEALLERVDTIFIGGAMAYTFLAARGIAIGNSRVESERLELALDIERRCHERGAALELPVDHVTGAALDGKNPSSLATSEGVAIDDRRLGLDIGPHTIEKWLALLDESVATVLWNGPVGLFEAEGCARGTEAIATHLAGHGAFRVLGGGDTAAAAARFGLDDRYDHVSTGGGAALELLSGKTLPGVEVLSRFA